MLREWGILVNWIALYVGKQQKNLCFNLQRLSNCFALGGRNWSKYSLTIKGRAASFGLCSEHQFLFSCNGHWAWDTAEMWSCHLTGRLGHDAVVVVETRGTGEGGTTQGTVFSLWSRSYIISRPPTPHSKSKEHPWCFILVFGLKTLGTCHTQALG